jgi:hypothetical protein
VIYDGFGGGLGCMVFGMIGIDKSRSLFGEEQRKSWHEEDG